MPAEDVSVETLLGRASRRHRRRRARRVPRRTRLSSSPAPEDRSALELCCAAGTARARASSSSSIRLRPLVALARGASARSRVHATRCRSLRTSRAARGRVERRSSGIAPMSCSTPRRTSTCPLLEASPVEGVATNVLGTKQHRRCGSPRRRRALRALLDRQGGRADERPRPDEGRCRMDRRRRGRETARTAATRRSGSGTSSTRREASCRSSGGRSRAAARSRSRIRRRRGT